MPWFDSVIPEKWRKSQIADKMCKLIFIKNTQNIFKI